MKNGKIIDGRRDLSMPVSHRIDAATFGRRRGDGNGASSAVAARPLNSSTVLIAAAVAFAIPATLFGLFADGSGLRASETPAAIGLRGSLPATANVPEKRSPS